MSENQAGLVLHEVLELEPRPVSFVNSLGLGDPPSPATIHHRLERYPGQAHGWAMSKAGYISSS